MSLHHIEDIESCLPVNSSTVCLPKKAAVMLAIIKQAWHQPKIDDTAKENVVQSTN